MIWRVSSSALGTTHSHSARFINREAELLSEARARGEARKSAAPATRMRRNRNRTLEACWTLERSSSGVVRAGWYSRPSARNFIPAMRFGLPGAHREFSRMTAGPFAIVLAAAGTRSLQAVQQGQPVLKESGTGGRCPGPALRTNTRPAPGITPDAVRKSDQCARRAGRAATRQAGQQPPALTRQ
jgi:hypothetical protein